MTKLREIFNFLNKSSSEEKNNFYSKFGIKRSLLYRYAKLLKHNCEIGGPCYSKTYSSMIIENENKRIVAFGYNGPPSGLPHADSEEWLEHTYKNLLNDQEKHVLESKYEIFNAEEFIKKFKKSNRCIRKIFDYRTGEKLNLCPCAHSEINTIINNCGRSLNGTTMISWSPIPCVNCSKYIVNSGIKNVICCFDINSKDLRTYDESGSFILEKSGVKLMFYEDDFSKKVPYQ
ncbi:MAG: hypothetical protein QXP60_02275 [Nitrososphaerota archaeon]